MRRHRGQNGPWPLLHDDVHILRYWILCVVNDEGELPPSRAQLRNADFFECPQEPLIHAPSSSDRTRMFKLPRGTVESIEAIQELGRTSHSNNDIESESKRNIIVVFQDSVANGVGSRSSTQRTLGNLLCRLVEQSTIRYPAGMLDSSTRVPADRATSTPETLGQTPQLDRRLLSRQTSRVHGGLPWLRASNVWCRSICSMGNSRRIHDLTTGQRECAPRSYCRLAKNISTVGGYLGLSFFFLNLKIMIG